MAGLDPGLLDPGSAQHTQRSQAHWWEGEDPSEDWGDSIPQNRGHADSPLLALASEGPGWFQTEVLPHFVLWRLGEVGALV